MDLNAIYAALQGTLSQNQQERQAAEAALKSLEGTPGYISALFRILNSKEASLEVRQAGIIYFKNLVLKNWERETPQQDEGHNWVIAEDDRAFIRQNMLEALVSSHPLCRPQVAESLKKIASIDFPAKLPGFLEQVAARLDPSVPPDEIHGALIALRVLTKNYEYKSSEKRKAINDILAVTFPRLVPLMEATLAAPLGDEKAAEMQKVMIKSLWSAVHQSIPLYLQDPAIFMQWMGLLYRVIEAPVPEAAQGVGQSADERKELGNLVFWKCKRWAAHILHRLFQKYGNPKLSEKQLGEERQGEVAISRAFHDQLANQFLQMFMSLLATISNGGFIPERLVVEASNYIMIAVTLAITWTQLKPNAGVLITQVLFPMLCFDAADQELWNDDPQEFVRKSNDIMEDFASQRVAASNLIIDLCKKRTASTLLPTLEFCVAHLKAYNAGSGEARLADGALLCIGSLSSSLQEKKMAAQYEAQVTWLLKELVAPLIKAPLGHLRSRAAWILAQFVKTVLKDQPFFQACTREIMTLLRDADLPVRFQAAVALRGLIYDPERSTARPHIEPIIGPVFPELLEVLFNLIDEIGSDELIATLEVLIECFADKMAPYAQALCERLSQHFLRLAAQDNGEGDEEASFAACQCCRAITTLLESIKKTPQLYLQLEPSLVPLIQTVLSPDPAGDYPYMEYMEDCLEILTYLTYYAPTITDGVWSLYNPLCQSFFDWAFDYLSNINLPLDNYISRCNERFLSDGENVQTIYKILRTVLETDEQSSERDCVEAAKLAESLILNCMGKIDAVIPPILALVVQRFRNNAPQKEFCRSELLKLVSNCLYYNPTGTLMALEQQGATNDVFKVWLESLQARDQAAVTVVTVGLDASTTEGEGLPPKTHFKGQHDKKVCILGLSSILRVPVAQLPPAVQAGLPFILAALVELLQDMENDRKKADEEEDDDDDDDEDGEENAVLDVNDDEDEDHVEEQDMDDVLYKLSQLRDGDGTWDDLFGDEEDDDEYSSPIDDIDELIFFVENFTLLQTNFPAETQQVRGSLPAEREQLLQAIINSAPQRAADNAAKKEAEKAAG